MRIEKFTQDDFHYYFQLVNNEKVMKMITERAILLEEAKENFNKLVESNKLGPNYGSFKILCSETSEFLGLAKLVIKENINEEAEIGFMILPEHWGRGIGSEIAKQLIEIGKKQVSLKRIFAIIDPRNFPSKKILLNNGFISTGLKEIDGLPGEILELHIK